jgi:hypothetical protein
MPDLCETSTCPSRGHDLRLSRDFAASHASRHHHDNTWTGLHDNLRKGKASVLPVQAVSTQLHRISAAGERLE